MALGLLLGLARSSFRRKRTSSLEILTSKRGPRGFYKGKNCIPTGFHTRKGGYVVVPEKLPNYVVPDLTGFKVLNKNLFLKKLIFRLLIYVHSCQCCFGILNLAVFFF
nr:39S ribosomal protein L41-A, mitochondrial-like [Ipomoea batatas]